MGSARNRRKPSIADEALNGSEALDRRTLEELATLHELQPDLRELYVEGAKDCLAYGAIIREIFGLKLDVIEINSLYIPNEIVELHGFGSKGNKGRVIAAAISIEKICNRSPKSIRFMADQDFWIIDKTRPECGILILTDSTCLEAYFLEKETIERY